MVWRKCILLCIDDCPSYRFSNSNVFPHQKMPQYRSMTNFKARYSTGISKTINKLFIFLHSNLRFLFLNAYTRFGMHLHYKWNTCFVVQIKLFFKPAKKCISQTNEKSINEYAHIQIIIAFTVNIKRNRAYLCKECYIPKFKTLETQYWRKP